MCNHKWNSFITKIKSQKVIQAKKYSYDKKKYFENINNYLSKNGWISLLNESKYIKYIFDQFIS